MSDNMSLIDAIKLVAKATRDDTARVSDMVKGALHPEQIDDMRLVLSPLDREYPPLAPATGPSWKRVDRQPSARRGRTPHPTIFATDAEVDAMTPRKRHLHDAQVSLHRQQQLLDDRYQRDSERLAQSVEEDLVNRFRSLLRVQPATEDEATTGGASASTATATGGATMPPAATRPSQPESPRSPRYPGQLWSWRYFGR